MKVEGTETFTSKGNLPSMLPQIRILPRVQFPSFSLYSSFVLKNLWLHLDFVSVSFYRKPWLRPSSPPVERMLLLWLFVLSWVAQMSCTQRSKDRMCQAMDSVINLCSHVCVFICRITNLIKKFTWFLIVLSSFLDHQINSYCLCKLMNRKHKWLPI